MNAASSDRFTCLQGIRSLDILTVLLDRGGDPTWVSRGPWTPLICQVAHGSVELVARLLQDPRVQAAVDEEGREGKSALHWACCKKDKEITLVLVRLLLQAGANPALTNDKGATPWTYMSHARPTHHATIALLEQFPHTQKDAEKASLLVKARRFAIAANSNTVAPSCLQARVARGRPLPCIALMRMTAGQNENEEEEEEGRKFRSLLAFLDGMEGGPEMPRDVFRVVLDLLMPSWDPLRCKSTGKRPSAVQS